MNKPCPFCENLDIILENDFWFSAYDKYPVNQGHILIIPKKPYINFYDFNKNASSDEILDFWKLINFIIETKNIENNGFRIITNSGKDGNQDVPHFHVHLLGGKNLGKMISLSG